MKRVIIDKKIMHGEPVIEGTRMPVSVVLGSLEEVMKEYDLSEEDIRAALRYAADLIIEDQVILLKKTP